MTESVPQLSKRGWLFLAHNSMRGPGTSRKSATIWVMPAGLVECPSRTDAYSWGSELVVLCFRILLPLVPTSRNSQLDRDHQPGLQTGEPSALVFRQTFMIVLYSNPQCSMSAMVLWMSGAVAQRKRAHIVGSASLPTGTSASSSQLMVG